MHRCYFYHLPFTNSSISTPRTLPSKLHELFISCLESPHHKFHHRNVTNFIFQIPQTLRSNFHEICHLSQTHSVNVTKSIGPMSQTLSSKFHRLYHLNYTNSIIDFLQTLSSTCHKLIISMSRTLLSECYELHRRPGHVMVYL